MWYSPPESSQSSSGPKGEATSWKPTMGASCLGLADESNGSNGSGRTRTSLELEVEGEGEGGKSVRAMRAAVVTARFSRRFCAYLAFCASLAFCRSFCAKFSCRFLCLSAFLSGCVVLLGFGFLAFHHAVHQLAF